MGVNSLRKTVTRQRRDCDLNPDPSAPESSTLTTRLPSHNTVAARNKSDETSLVQLPTSAVIVALPAFGIRTPLLLRRWLDCC